METKRETRKWLWLLLLVATACGPSQQRSEVSRKSTSLDLPNAPSSNIWTNRIAEVPITGAIRMIPRSAFNAKIAELGSEAFTGRFDQLQNGLQFGEIANDGWTSGVVATVKDEDVTIDGQIWFVVDDAMVWDGSRLLASQYSIAVIEMQLHTPWFGHELVFTQQPSQGGMGRCCGPEKTTCQNPGVAPDVCGSGPNEMCGDVRFTPLNVGAYSVGPGIGRPTPEVIAFNSGGIPINMACLPKPMPSCMYATVMCDGELGGVNWGRDWEAPVPNGSQTCGAPDRPASGRQVPEFCEYANEIVQCKGGPGGGCGPTGGGDTIKGPARPGGSGERPDCEGRCIGCESGKPHPDENFRPRQCALYTPGPSTPGGAPGQPGSGVCDSTPNTALVEQSLIHSLVGTSTECQSGHNGIQFCAKCTPGGSCDYEVKRGPNPIAADTPSAGSGTPSCNGSNTSSCTPPANPSGGAGGGTGAAGGTGGMGAGAGTGGTGGSSAQPLPPNQPASKPSTQAPPSKPTPAPAPGAARPKEKDSNSGGPQNDTKKDPAKGADPVVLSSGDYVISHTDLSFPGAVRSLEFTRNYSSQTAQRSEMGSNWTHNWDVRLIPLNDTNRPNWVDPFCAGSPGETTCLMLHVGDSTRLFVRDPTTGVYMPQAGVSASVIPLNNASGWLMTGVDGHNLLFDADGYLARDTDRFGNAFSVEYELNAAGRLWKALCPKEPVKYVYEPANPWGASFEYIYPAGASGVYHWGTPQCALLNGMVGVSNAMAPRLWDPLGGYDFDLTGANTPENQAARDLINFYEGYNVSAGPHKRRLGSPTPWGQRVKRVKRVFEVATVSETTGVPTSTGRELSFEYYADTDLTPVGGSTLRRAGLLRRVSGPGGGQVTFSYDAPTAAAPAGSPEWLNEAFLTRAERTVGPAASLDAASGRTKVYVYAWSVNTLAAAELANAVARYEKYLKDIVNCTYTTINHCGQPAGLGFQTWNVPIELEEYEGNFRAAIADNIIRVETHAATMPVIDAESLYETSVFSPNFDRVTKQRWGSTLASPTPAAPGFITTLPEATLSYVESTPTPGGDLTSDWLPTEIASRYALEDSDNAQVAAATMRGLLLPPRTDVQLQETPPLGRLPLIADGMSVPAVESKPACRLAMLPERRASLAGYRPWLDYKDPPLPTTGPNVKLIADGVDANMALKRSRLSCERLAIAQTWDSTSNDLSYTWIKGPDGRYVVTPVTHRRSVLNANANRICSWTKLVDRDGVHHVYGLNYQGRQLVDAVRLMVNGQASWRFAETLYNADGNVLSQRRTKAQGVAWTPTSGDTLYQYMDVLTNPTTGSQTDPMHAYWLRRSNLVSITERPAGGSVNETTDDGSGTESTTGRYVEYEYEPLFNQAFRITSGYLSTAGLKVPLSRTTLTLDYQEASVSAVAGVLGRLRQLGYRFPLNGAGQLDLAAAANGVPVPFGVGDVNGDGIQGGTLAGLPVRVTYQDLATGLAEATVYRWNPTGRPYFVQLPNGSSIHTRFLPKGALNGTGTVLGTGFVAAVHYQPSKTYPLNDGPGRSPCAALAGPYQWLLPSTCSPDGLQAQLESQLHLPSEAAAAIAARQALPGDGFDGTTRYEYNAAGGVSRVYWPDGSYEVHTRDVDGRLLYSQEWDGSSIRGFRYNEYDAHRRLRATQYWDGVTYATLDQRSWEYDEEDRVIYECRANDGVGCHRGQHGELPTSGTSATSWFSPEGHLIETMDADGYHTTYVRDERGWVKRITRDGGGATARVEGFQHDDDGNVVSAWAGSETTALATETRSYDGYGRLDAITDAQQRFIKLHHSKRDLLVQARVRASPAGAELWEDRYEYDAFGRVLREYTNETLIREVWRRAGGQIWKSRQIGQRPQVTTYDNDGTAVYSEDESGEQIAVVTGSPTSRTVTSSTISKAAGTVRTTSQVLIVDANGAPLSAKETGAATGEARLTRTSTYQRDALGRMKQSVDADGATNEFVYDVGGRLVVKRELTPASLATTTYAFNRRGLLTTLTDPNGEATTTSYNGFGEPQARTSPGAPTITESWAYDVLGRVVTETRGPTTRHYDYSSLNRLDRIRGLETTLRDFLYDDLGRVTRARHHNLGLAPIAAPDRLVTNNFTYDALGRLASESMQIGVGATRTTSSTWSQRAEAHAPFTRTVGRGGLGQHVEQYDSLGRLSVLQRAATTATTSTTFQGAYPTTLNSQVNGGSTVSTAVTFDVLGQPLRWHTTRGGDALVDLSVLRDNVGRVGARARTTTTGLGGQQLNDWRGYHYDVAGRIERLYEASQLPSAGGAQTHTLTPGQIDTLAASAVATRWNYSREGRVGSLLALSEHSGTLPARFQNPVRVAGYELRQYAANGGPARAVDHDAAGRVVQEGNRTYVWDDFSSLTRVNGPTTESYAYDGLGRVAARFDGAGLVQSYLYDGEQMVAALSGSGSVLWQATWGAGIDSLVALKGPDSEYLALHDGTGSIGTLVDVASGTVAASAEYTPEGVPFWRTFSTAGYQTGQCQGASCAGALGFPFGFHSAFTSSTGLVYFRNRWYSPEANQWLSQDPVGPVDSHDLFAFNRFDAINFVDPWGLEAGKGSTAGKRPDPCAGLQNCTSVHDKRVPEGPGSKSPQQQVSQSGGASDGDPPSDQTPKCTGMLCAGLDPGKTATDQVLNSPPGGVPGTTPASGPQGPTQACGTGCVFLVPAAGAGANAALAKALAGVGIGLLGVTTACLASETCKKAVTQHKSFQQQIVEQVIKDIPVPPKPDVPPGAQPANQPGDKADTPPAAPAVPNTANPNDPDEDPDNRAGKRKPGESGGPGAGKRFSDKTKDAAEKEAGGKCVFCGKDTTRARGPRQRNTDHAQPKSQGGNNSLDNAQNTCRTCNLDKGARSTAEYLKYLFGGE